MKSSPVPGDRAALLVDQGPAGKIAPANGGLQKLDARYGRGALGGALFHFGRFRETLERGPHRHLDSGIEASARLVSAHARTMETVVPGFAAATSTVAPNCLASASTMPVPRPGLASAESLGMPIPVSRTVRVQAGPSDR